MSRRHRDPVELASVLGAQAFDLYQHGNVKAIQALRVVAGVNPAVMTWLRDALVAALTGEHMADGRPTTE